MFLKICIQNHFVVFALGRQINKQAVCENNFLCAVNKVSVKYQAKGGVNPKTPLRTPLSLKIHSIRIVFY